MFWHQGFILTFCLDTKRFKKIKAVPRRLPENFGDAVYVLGRHRYRPASCPLLKSLSCCKNALGRLRHSTCPAANAVGMPGASNDDFAND